MNAKQAFEKMMAARSKRMDEQLAPVMVAIEQAVAEGSPHTLYYERLEDGTIEELRRRGFKVKPETGMNELWWRISWPKPEGAK